MTDKIRNLLEDVQTVYEGKGMVVHPNSFDKLRMEVIKLDNISKQQSEQLTKAKELIKTLLLIADNKVSQMEFQLCIADAKQFLKDSEVVK